MAPFSPPIKIAQTGQVLKNIYLYLSSILSSLLLQFWLHGGERKASLQAATQWRVENLSTGFCLSKFKDETHKIWRIGNVDPESVQGRTILRQYEQMPIGHGGQLWNEQRLCKVEHWEEDLLELRFNQALRSLLRTLELRSYQALCAREPLWAAMCWSSDLW